MQDGIFPGQGGHALFATAAPAFGAFFFFFFFFFFRDHQNCFTNSKPCIPGERGQHIAALGID
eukprot:7383480-Prymnesium_polylepis.1